MSKTKISEYSATANSNTDVGGINIDEGCAPSGINDAIRTLMAQLKNFQTGTGGDSFNGPVGSTTASTGAFTTLSATGVATFSAGSASAPALTTSGDTNTGVLFPAADTIALTTGGTERARVDSSGNLGLGVTPSAWGTYKAVQVGNTSLSTSGASGTTAYITGNGYYNGTNWIYQSNDYASRYACLYGNGTHAWFTAPSGTAGNAISFTQAMTLTAAGNLGIGTTNPDILSYRVINAVGSGTSQGGLLNLDVSDGSATFRLYSNSSGATISMDDNLPMVFNTNGTERARIDSSGNLLVGTTSATPAGITAHRLVVERNTSVYAAAFGYSPDSVARTQVTLFNSNGAVGTISTSGSATTYATSSDYRLKNTVEPMTGALAKVAALKPVTYKWNVDGSDGEGFIAHELQSVVPDAVFGEKDAVDADGNPVYQGIDTSFLVATLTAAIQELAAASVEQQAIITQLQADVAALKA